MNLDGGGSGYDDLSESNPCSVREGVVLEGMQYSDDIQPGAAHLVLP